MKTVRPSIALVCFAVFSTLAFGQTQSGPTPLPSAKIAKEMRDKQEAAQAQLVASEKRVVETQKALDAAKKQATDDTTKLTKATSDAKLADATAQKDLQDLLATIEASRKLLENTPVVPPVVGKATPPKAPPVVAPIEPTAPVEEGKDPAKSNVKQTTLPNLPPDPVIPAAKEDKVIQQEVPKLKATPFVVGKKSIYEAEDKEKTTPVEKKTGSIVVTTSSSAAVTIDGAATATSGKSRSFITPELEVGSTYTYTIRAVHSDGRSVEKRVEITGGGKASVSLE